MRLLIILFILCGCVSQANRLKPEHRIMHDSGMYKANFYNDRYELIPKDNTASNEKIVQFNEPKVSEQKQSEAKENNNTQPEAASNNAIGWGWFALGGLLVVNIILDLLRIFL